MFAWMWHSLPLFAYIPILTNHHPSPLPLPPEYESNKWMSPWSIPENLYSEKLRIFKKARLWLQLGQISFTQNDIFKGFLTSSRAHVFGIRGRRKRGRGPGWKFFFFESFNLQHFSNFLFRYQIENQKYQQTKSFKRTVSLQIECCFQAIILKRNETPNTCQKW